MQQAGGAWRWERYTRASSAASGIEVGNAIRYYRNRKNAVHSRSTYYFLKK